jgi:hypothetical protein
MHRCGQQVTFHINDHLALAVFDLFAAVEATLATSFGGFDDWLSITIAGVHFHGLGAHAHADAIGRVSPALCHRRFIYRSSSAPCRWRKVEWDHRPLAASPILIHQCIQNTSEIDMA